MNLYLLRCMHLATSSDLLFKFVSGSARKMASFFCQAQLAARCAAAVRFGFANDGPFYDRNVTLIFESPSTL